MDSVYDLAYAIFRLRDAVEYTEMTHDMDGFRAIRQWINEIEKSAATEVHVHTDIVQEQS